MTPTPLTQVQCYESALLKFKAFCYRRGLRMQHHADIAVSRLLSKLAKAPVGVMVAERGQGENFKGIWVARTTHAQLTSVRAKHGAVAAAIVTRALNDYMGGEE